jgi:uncharacterized membrane protein YukC
MVLSDGYREIVAQTPHVRYQTPVVVWVALGLIVLLVLTLVLIAFLNL